MKFLNQAGVLVPDNELQQAIKEGEIDSVSKRRKMSKKERSKRKETLSKIIASDSLIQKFFAL